MKYNTRRRKSAAVKRGKRKNLKNRRKTRRGGTLGRYTTSFKSHSRSTRSDESADFGADRFRGMLLHMLANKDIPDETKNILKEIQDSQVDDRYNWKHVYIKLRHIPGLAKINAGSLDSGNPEKKYMNAVRILMKNLSEIDYKYAFREPSYAPGYIGYNP